MNCLILEREDLCKVERDLPSEYVAIPHFSIDKTLVYNSDKIIFVDGEYTKVLKERRR